jgi:hypothetical protein
VQIVSESLASILLNSSNLLRIDLDGVNVLAPSLLTALEAVLPEKEVRDRWNFPRRKMRLRREPKLKSSMIWLAGPIYRENLILINSYSRVSETLPPN